MDSLTIATPFYNEEESIENFFNTLKKIHLLISKKVDLNFLFIDDGSNDLTKKKLLEFKENNPNYNIEIFFHDKNYGYGRTLKNSIRLSKTKYMITYDADCTYEYKIINLLIDKIKESKADIINVSYKLAENNIKLSLLRKTLSWGSSFLYRIFFPETKNYNVNVYTCSFRIYELEKIKKIQLKSEDFNCCAELLIRAILNNYKIFEVPGQNLGRKYGYSKMKIIKNIYNSIKTLFIVRFGL